MFTLIGPHRLHLFPDQTDRHARDENGDGQWRRGKMITAIHTADLAGENHDQRKQNSDSSGKNFIDKKKVFQCECEVGVMLRPTGETK